MFTVKSVNKQRGLYSICLGQVPISRFSDDNDDITYRTDTNKTTLCTMELVIALFTNSYQGQEIMKNLGHHVFGCSSHVSWEKRMERREGMERKINELERKGER
jgi:hypothetical protein